MNAEFPYTRLILPLRKVLNLYLFTLIGELTKDTKCPFTKKPVKYSPFFVNYKTWKKSSSGKNLTIFHFAIDEHEVKTAWKDPELSEVWKKLLPYSKITHGDYFILEVNELGFVPDIQEELQNFSVEHTMGVTLEDTKSLPPIRPIIDETLNSLYRWIPEELANPETMREIVYEIVDKDIEIETILNRIEFDVDYEVRIKFDDILVQRESLDEIIGEIEKVKYRTKKVDVYFSKLNLEEVVEFGIPDAAQEIASSIISQLSLFVDEEIEHIIKNNEKVIENDLADKIEKYLETNILEQFQAGNFNGGLTNVVYDNSPYESVLKEELSKYIDRNLCRIILEALANKNVDFTELGSAPRYGL